MDRARWRTAGAIVGFVPVVEAKPEPHPLMVAFVFAVGPSVPVWCAVGRLVWCVRAGRPVRSGLALVRPVRPGPSVAALSGLAMSHAMRSAGCGEVCGLRAGFRLVLGCSNLSLLVLATAWLLALRRRPGRLGGAEEACTR
jgi:hypothetical protein